MSSSCAPVLLLVFTAAACRYDLDLLRGRDAGPDARPPDGTPPDATAPDLFVMDVRADRPPSDATMIDAAPSRDASMGACMGRDVIPLAPDAPGVLASNGVLTVQGNTTGGEATIPGCLEPRTIPSSTRVYRYVVQTGPRVVATTNTGLCGMAATGAHDTILSAFFNCSASGLVPDSRSCNDDDEVNVCDGMTACSDNTSLGCGIKFSTLELSRLLPGDVVYFAVSSYMDSPILRGPFRLSVAENGLSPAAPPTRSTDGSPQVLPTDRCACSPSTPPFEGWASSQIRFPNTTDSNQLMGTARIVVGQRPIEFSRVWGLSASFRLSAFNVSTTGDCAVSGGAKAALDVILGTRVVASVSLGIYVGAAGTVTIPFTSFAPISFTPGSTPQIQYQLRNVQPADTTCVTLNIDTNAPNTLTLYGMR